MRRYSAVDAEIRKQLLSDYEWPELACASDTSCHRREAASHVKRLSLPSAVDDRLYFAQVREDPRLEIEALAPGPDRLHRHRGLGRCTALSLLAPARSRRCGGRQSRTESSHRAQVAALTVLSRAESLAFLGAIRSASRAPPRLRELRAHLTPAALAYWDTHRLGVAAGVLNAGVTERFIRTVLRMLRLAVHPRARIERMLASDTLNAQRFLFESEWNTAMWRAFFHLLLNRAVFRRAYDPAFFAHLERPSFADHFRWQAEHALTELSVRDNYFLHHMLAGQYPMDTAGGVPPYLSEEACVSVSTSRERLTLVDGTITDHLRGLPDGA
jgi:S-adenosylmethionine-diacylglycerol 3-amino-3-carboxypropyl transferase